MAVHSVANDAVMSFRVPPPVDLALEGSATGLTCERFIAGVFPRMSD